MINKKSKIYIAGHNGLVGSAILRKFRSQKYSNLIYRTRKQLDLTNQSKVFSFLKKKKPDAVIIAAAKVGGIHANNTAKANFIYENLSIQNNLIHGSYKAGVKNLIFLGSSCVYPRDCKQPIKEEYLLSDYLEKTNEPYAIAKIAGISLCSSYNFQYKLNYKCLMPCNAYGINDNYDLNTSHFLPAMIKKIIHAVKNKKDYITIWGSGKPLREVIISDDIADACLFFLNKKTKENLINVGSGIEYSIKDYLIKIMKHLDVDFKINYISSKPDGMYRKRLDLSVIKKYGWKSKFSLDDGIRITLKNYLKNSNLKL